MQAFIRWCMPGGRVTTIMCYEEPSPGSVVSACCAYAHALGVALAAEGPEAGREHDEDPRETDDDRDQAKGAHLLAEEHGREDDSEQRRGIADRRHLGQGQKGKPRKAEAHRRRAGKAAPQMPERILRPQTRRHLAP